MKKLLIISFALFLMASGECRSRKSEPEPNYRIKIIEEQRKVIRGNYLYITLIEDSETGQIYMIIKDNGIKKIIELGKKDSELLEEEEY